MQNGSNNSKTNLIINYLPQSLSDDEFRKMFLEIGPVNSCKVVRDRATNYSYGFGFVDYVSEEHAQQAIASMNGMQLQNKRLKVALARTGEDVKGANLYVSNMPKSVGQEELQAAFTQFGEIINCRVLTESSGVSKGVGFVLFNKREQAEAALAGYNGKSLPGHTEIISVKYADDNRGKARAPAGQQPPYSSYTYGPAMAMGRYGAAGRGYGVPRRPYGGPPGPMRSMGGMAGRYRYNPVNAYSPAAMGHDMGEEEGHIIFIYNINPDADERFLWQLFAPYGAVKKVNVIKDFQKNQGKGYGFVTMPNYHEAAAAISELNGFIPTGGKPLQVSFKTSK